MVTDGFTLAKGAPDLPEAEAWLETVGSKQAQESFNALKGSIPARADVDLTHFGVYQRWSMACFAHDALLPSGVHGEAAPVGFPRAMNDAVNSFVANRHVDQLADALVRAAAASGLR
jgi:glucose/mannose transport system substrate-binding protein